MYSEQVPEQALFSVVVPVLNEQESVKSCWERLTNVLKKIHGPYEILFVNDGSTDNTAGYLNELQRTDPHTKVIQFSRNFGHQAAITAGMERASGDAIIVIDADLQDPPEVIPRMIDRWKAGYHVVYGVRSERKGETFFKNASAFVFYRLLQRLTEVQIPNDTGDFRLIDKTVNEILKKLPEKNRYVRGLVSWSGFRQIGIEYTRHKRTAGKSKYPFRKMLAFAFDAVTAFSKKPLRFAAVLGCIISAASFIYLVVVVYLKLFTSSTVPGWSSLIALNLFFNGFILIVLGLFGEYIGRIYDEVKSRPLYIIERMMGFEKPDAEKETNNR